MDYLTRLVVIDESHVFYEFNPGLEPVARVKPGDLVVFKTLDALGGQVKSEEDTIEKIDFTRVNPATGPLYVEDTGPGDVLVVDVLSLEVSGRGVIVTAPGEGVLGERVDKAKTRVCMVNGDYVEFKSLKLPAWRMIGVIGVASDEKPSTGIPGRHGGNLDTKYITAGSRVYLPVFHEGGLLGIGDLHALMGHGEICVSACEVSGSVLVRVGVVKNTSLPWPIVDYGGSLYILVSMDSINDALREAARVAVETLSRALRIDWIDAYMLASLGVDVGVSQLVDPRKTAWARIPKHIVQPDTLLKALSEIRPE
ncbi:acetamidase/formamidase family protein [Desulfurococcus amylolyticus]|uniref:acetamidase/formamidase family protein n=1 Tax=Desulfurococcus amylolyticus TaxID=94694 RepID=UPI0023F3BCC1|nr:acetamidase/formamidase family protein [Desulfurococcus amylolyticus]